MQRYEHGADDPVWAVNRSFNSGISA